MARPKSKELTVQVFTSIPIWQVQMLESESIKEGMKRTKFIHKLISEGLESRALKRGAKLNSKTGEMKRVNLMNGKYEEEEEQFTLPPVTQEERKMLDELADETNRLADELLPMPKPYNP